jgi:molybdenum cofactor biosynthesis enzyme MoaA
VIQSRLRRSWPRHTAPACLVTFPAPAHEAATPLWGAVREALAELGQAATGLPTTVFPVRSGGEGDAAPARSVRLLASLSYLLAPDPPPAELLRRAEMGLVVLAVASGRPEVRAACFRTPVRRADVERAVALVSGGGTLELRDRPRFDVRVAARPSSLPAPPLSAALTEMAGDDGADIPRSADPGGMAAGLLALRDRSRVPWVLNTLANQVEYRMGVARMASVPPEVHLSLTSACNIECRFCSYTHQAAQRDAVGLRQVQSLGFLRHLHTFRLSSGLGEPTLAPDLPAILEWLGEAHPHLHVNFFTNGLLLGQDRVRRAVVGRGEWINVSLNAARRETWADVCGGDHWARVCSSLRALAAEKRSRGASRPAVYGSVVVTTENVGDLPEMPAICRELGVDRLTVIPFYAQEFDGRPGKYGARHAFTACREAYDRAVPEILRRAEEHRVTVDLPPPSPDSRVQEGLEVRAVHDFAGLAHDEAAGLGRLADHLVGAAGRANARCHWLWTIALLGKTDRRHAARGTTHFLYPCLGPLGLVDLSERTPFDFPEGDGLLRVWNSPTFVALRAAQDVRGRSPVCDACRSLDTRDPAHFPLFQGLLRDWAAPLFA